MNDVYFQEFYQDLTPDERRARGNRCSLSFIRPGYTCVEVGVLFGDFSLQILGKNPSSLLLVDSWTLDPRRNPGMRGVSGDQMHKEVLERFAENPKVRVLRETSLNAVNIVADASLDFVYIDADHIFHSIWRDLQAWAPKVKPGGILAGHDYLYFSKDYSYPVHRAVDAFWSSNPDFAPVAFSNDWVLRRRPLAKNAS